MEWASQLFGRSPQKGISTSSGTSRPNTNNTRAFVTIADVNDERGNNLAKELHPYGTHTPTPGQD